MKRRLWVGLAAACAAACNSDTPPTGPNGPTSTSLRLASWTACYDTVTSRNIPVQREASPQLVELGSGALLTVWIQCDGSLSNLRGSVFQPGSGWSTPLPIGSGTDDRFPALAASSNGEATALWTAGGHVWENRFTRGGGWQQARQVDIGELGTPAVYMRQGGEAVAVWAMRSATASALWASRRVAGTWARGEAISLAPGDFSLVTTADAAANVTVAWTDGAGALFSARYAFDSGWSAVERLAESRTVEPSISSSAAGHSALEWRETPSSAVMARFNTGAGWSAPVRVDRSSSDPPIAPQVDIGSQGGVGAWNTQNLSEIWASRLASNGEWATPVRLGGGRSPVVATDDRGNAAAAWIASTANGAFRVEGSHLAGSAWSPAGALRTGEAVAQIGRPALVAGADEYVTAIWAAQASPNTSSDVVELWTSRATLR